MEKTNRNRWIQWLAFVGWMGFGLFALGGCGSNASESGGGSESASMGSDATAGTESTSRDAENVDHLSVARRMAKLSDWEASAEAAYKALLEEPDSFDAMLLASEAEVARGNFERSLSLAETIDPEWRLGERAVFVHARSLYELGRLHEAADVFLQAAEREPSNGTWRRRAWSLLNQLGRREEASEQAESLCRAGQANNAELISLLRRTDAFPAKLPSTKEPTDVFESGLGVARWYFTQSEFRKALDELKPQSDSKFESAAASALYGRLLAETQSLDEFPDWHANCDLEQVQKLGDYWAALGTFFFDKREYQASAKALLEAVMRNPTDRKTVQRLARVFDALGQADTAEQFRQRGIDLAQTEGLSDSLQTTTGQSLVEQQSLCDQLTGQLLQLDRPFEVLAWAQRMNALKASNPGANPSGIAQQQQALERKRLELMDSRDARVMSREASLLGVDLDEFELGEAFAKIVGNTRPSSNEQQVTVTQLGAPRLVNVATQAGIHFQWYQDLEVNLESIPIHESVGGGIAVIDFDLDGWPDVYLAQGSGEPPTDACTRSNVFVRNEGGRFVDVTALAGAEDRNYGSGLAAGDVNQDGFPDLFVGSLGRNRLLINNGDGTFRDATDQLGDIADRFSTSLAIADINGDALPDLFEAIYIEMEGGFAKPKIGKDGRETQPSPLEHFAQSDRWYSSSGDGRFQIHEISREIARPGTSLGVVVTDFDQSGKNEVFVGNDVRPNHFLIQTGEDTFLNAADAKGVANGFSGAANGCMGIATGDFNHDGTLDLHITNFHSESANLFLQSSGGFTDYAVRYRLDESSLPYVGFGTKAVDIDRNGWLDLVVTNGHIFDMSSYGEGFQMPPQLLMNRGSSFEQVDVEDDSGYWEQEYLGRTMAMLDYDRDGVTDLLVNHLDQPLALLKNETSSEGQVLQLELVGTKSERDAIGARVQIIVGGQTRTSWVTAGDGYFCTDEPVVEFGLGLDPVITRVTVDWPSGEQQILDGPITPGRFLIIEGESESFPR
ncbi:MAG: FG-GAP-like repeat-containing protein [Planctomycetota bacterium]